MTAFAKGRRGIARRTALLGAGALALAGAGLRTATASADAMAAQAALRRLIGDAVPKDGKVLLTMAPIAENGTSVPMTVAVDSPMTAEDHVRRIVVLADGNPNPEVAVFNLGPRAGRAEVSTRIRLARTQTVLAIAELSDTSLWIGRTEVTVTVGGCAG